MVAGVHMMASVVPAPTLHCAVPPAPVQLPVYVVVCDGDTEMLPDVVPPDEKEEAGL